MLTSLSRLGTLVASLAQRYTLRGGPMLVLLRGVPTLLVLCGAALLNTAAFAQGDVSPQSGSATMPINTPNNSLSFRVTNNSGTGELVRFECERSGAVTSCTPPPGVNINDGQAVDVNVTFATGAQGVGTLTLVAWGPAFGQDSGRYEVTALAPPAATTYNVAYDANGKLDRITDPAGRVLEATVSGVVLETLKDPSGDSVVYGYDGAQRLAARINRRGHQTTYRYVTNLRVTSFEIPLSSPTDLGITSFTHWDEGALVIGQPGGTHTPQDPAVVYTQLDGPRTDVPDVTRFWVDRWGAPVRIEANALGTGNNTYLTRGDPAVPALITELQMPNGFVTRATYDARGNILTMTEVDPYGPTDPRDDPVTSYAWDPAWDFVTKINRPEGDSVVMAYQAANGNRLWQQDGRGDSSRVTFQYSNSHNLLSAVVLPGGARHEVRYSGELGNPFWSRTPMGFTTTRHQDLMGRDTLVLSPIDMANVSHQRQRTMYDPMNRVREQHTVGPAMSGAEAESVLVRNTYDAEGNLEALVREASPDLANIGEITTQWDYDLAGRAVKEIAPFAPSNPTVADSTVYDPAGNPTKVITRRADTLTMVYDTLNRLTQRRLSEVTYPSRPTSFNITEPRVIEDYAPHTIPAETHSFTYDAAGRLLTADNADAKVKRSYYPNGLPETDSLRIQTVRRDDWDRHKYGLRYVYDLNGRRLSLDIPQALAPGGATTISYAYHPQLDALESVTDLRGNPYVLGYNARGELSSIGYPGSHSEGFTYDADGRLATDSILNSGGTTYPRFDVETVRATSFAYDARDRMVWSGDPVKFKDTLYVSYSGLGHLFRSQLIQRECHGSLNDGCQEPMQRYTTHEAYTNDALANRTGSVITDTLATSTEQLKVQGPTERTSGYEQGTGRLLADTSSNDVITTYSYDAAGNIEFSSSLHAPAEERASFFAADGSLRAVDYRWAADAAANLETQKYTFEEYRYDALGRRVWLRAEKWCNDVSAPDFVSVTEGTECRTSVLRRTIWDGDRELIEIQMPWGLQHFDTYTVDSTESWWENDGVPVSLGTVFTSQGEGDPNPYFGHVVYTAGRGIDQPIAITRVNYVMALDLYSRDPDYRVKTPFTIIPFWNTRGDAPLGAFNNGAAILCFPPESTTACVRVLWPWFWSAFDPQREMIRDTWYGTLLESKRDKSGLGYLRNRYYDPATGRFTQEDPIGLAGGLNLYGFAAGDPISFGDPFGLCKIELRALRPYSSVPGARHAWHTFIITTEPDNTQTVFRGGSSRVNADERTRSREKGTHAQDEDEGELGHVTYTEDRYVEGTVDWKPGAPSTTIVDNDEPCDKHHEAFRTAMTAIEQARIPYKIFGPNSNSLAYQLLVSAGLRPPKVRARPSVFNLEFAPGWGMRLLP